MARTKDTGSRVAFSHRAPEAESVFLSGTFNDWSTDAAPMHKDATGNWSVSLRLEPGRYEYKFVVDGEWCATPACASGAPSVECVTNAFGTLNRVIEVR